MPDNYAIELFKTGLTLIVGALGFLATWGVGDRLTSEWNLRQKRKELNLEAVRAFHSLYGEFKEVVKIWRLAVRRPALVQDPQEERWKLLVRACAIEAKTETFVLSLATERRLSADQCESIGLFRQAMQTLRESVRNNVDCPLGSRREGYRLLNQLAPQVSAIVSARLPHDQPSPDVAQTQLAKIVGVTSDSWKLKLKSLAAHPPQLQPAEAEEEDEDQLDA